MSKSRRSSAVILLGIVLTGSLVASSAEARLFMPAEIAQVTGAECEPPCTICHQDNNGGFGTAVTPFVGKLLNAGLDVFTDAPPSNFAVVMNDLQSIGEDDMDEDGMPDFEELQLGFDPNPDGVRFCGTAPEYGCAARIAPHSDTDTTALGASALVTLVLLGASRVARRR
jgi:hypothetical protein